MADTSTETSTEITTGAGRAGQRRRTRDAILAAAASLLSAGHTPSVGEVADAAEVSRRTVYMYFPTLEQLLVDATLGTLSRETVDAAIDTPDDDGDVQARVERMARAVQRLSATTEQQGRTLMRLTAVPSEGSDSRTHPPRGYRRVQWIERALAPLRARLDAAQFERLVTSLSLVLGWEALIVERDIRGLSLAEAEDASAWAARALVAAAIAEIDDVTPAKLAKPARAAVKRGSTKKPPAGASKKRKP